MKSLTYVELDLPYCANTYGSAPCTASIPATGPYRCYNSKRTCQDRPNYVNTTAVLRFAVDSDYLPTDIECIPNIVGIEYDGQMVSLGQDLGQRATLTVSFRELRHSDTGTGFDKYLSSRGFSPFTRGTFWSKFRARHPYLRGALVRLRRGFVGQGINSMETRTFVVESFTGPNENGIYTITSKDVLKIADDDRAKCPRLSNGYLSAGITNVATSATLAPVGVGNSEYPASGYVAIAGKEVCSFTRAGDVLTLTRAQLNTTAIAHSAEDRVQVVAVFAPATPANIINTLLTTYAGVSSSNIPLTEWQSEVNNYLQRNYSGYVAEPTGVNQLVSELIEQAALAMWWDDLNGLIRLQVLREIPTNVSTFDDSNIIEGTFSVRDQPEKRVSQVWTYFGQRNPLEPIDRRDNYRSTLVSVDLQAESDYGSPAVKEIFSRWIPALGRTVAERVNQIQLARYRDPPRRFMFSAWRSDEGSRPIALGGGYQVGSWMIQDDTGLPVTTPVQVVHLRPGAERMIAEAEEMLFNGFITDDPTIHNLSIDIDSYNLNLRTVHDSIFPVPVLGNTINVTIKAGVKVGSTSISSPAIDVGTWPVGVTVNIINLGRIQGKGGAGGFLAAPTAGGPALYTRRAINLTNAAGQVWGGGGGGTYKRHGSTTVSGGGGAGFDPGVPAATTEAGGTPIGFGGFTGGAGGGPGLAGETGAQTGGAAGAAVDGTSYVTYVSAGDRRGGLIN